MLTRNHYNNISYVIDRYIPQYIKDNYPLYYDFIETYYEYLQQNDYVAYNMVKSLQDWNDVDTTLDDFIEYFKNEYINLPIEEDWGLYIKHYKEIYASKGSSKSLEFFIKLLTGLNVDVYYPNRYLMKSSDGIYRSYTIIFSERVDNINYNDYISTKVKGRITNASGIIEKIEIYDNYVKLFLSSCKGQFSNEPIIFNNGIEFETNLINTISSINIDKIGNNYSLNDIISIDNYPLVKFKINSIYSGGLDKINITNGGTGYAIGDTLHFECDEVEEYYSLPIVKVTDIDESGSILNVDILNDGYGLLSIPKLTYIETSAGTGAQFELYSKYAGGLKSISLVNTVENIIETPNLIIQTNNGTGAQLSLNIGYQYQEVPYYYKAGSFLSDIFKLQDSYYWQEYSYVLNVTGNVLEKYKNVFKTLLHPAGYIFFTNTELANYISLNKRYIDSIISTGNVIDIDKNKAQYIELLHYNDRIRNDNIIYPYRKDEIKTLENEAIESKQTIGGSFVSSSLEIGDPINESSIANVDGLKFKIVDNIYVARSNNDGELISKFK